MTAESGERKPTFEKSRFNSLIKEDYFAEATDGIFEPKYSEDLDAVFKQANKKSKGQQKRGDVFWHAA